MTGSLTRIRPLFDIFQVWSSAATLHVIIWCHNQQIKGAPHKLDNLQRPEIGLENSCHRWPSHQLVKLVWLIHWVGEEEGSDWIHWNWNKELNLDSDSSLRSSFLAPSPRTKESKLKMSFGRRWMSECFSPPAKQFTKEECERVLFWYQSLI